MDILHKDDEDTIITTTDDEDEDGVDIETPLDTSYAGLANDEEFDPYNSGLNDFTFEDSVDENEVI